MNWPLPPAAVLNGPRGRRLCWELVQAALAEAEDWQENEQLLSAARRGGMSGVVDALAVYAADLAQTLSGEDDQTKLLTALTSATQLAMYWQEPDPDDIALDEPGVRAALLPVAGALAQSPEARWWASPLDRAGQQYVQWPEAEAALLTGIPAALARWRDTEAADEAADRPHDPAANWSGHWWSIPALARLPATTRTLPGFGPAGLALTEDPSGWQQARCQPVQPQPGARCYEVDGPEAWAELTGRYPFEVSRSRRQDWWRVTGWAGPWLMPDYAAVAADYDAVHLTVLGYLITAGRDLPAGQDGARTVLAGWPPDTTYWLNDVLSPAGAATEWVQGKDYPLWSQVS